MSNEPFRQRIPKLNLSIERGTESVPDDGQFYVLLEGEVVFRSRLQARALERYREIRETLLAQEPGENASADPREALKREMAYIEAEALRSEGVGASRRGQKWRARRGGVRG